MSRESESIVSLTIQAPKYMYPKPLDEVDSKEDAPRPHDPLTDNGILLSSISERTAAKDFAVRCYNDVPMACRRVNVTQKDRALLLAPFFQDGLPKTTDVSCWWCCHKFSTPPIGAPFVYKHVEDMFGGCGCFCGFSCALAWLQDHQACHKYIPLLRFMRQKQTNAVASEGIKPAPPREMLAMFGGSLSIEEFRDESSQFCGLRMVHVPNMFPIEIRVEDRSATSAESSSVLQFLRNKTK